MELARCLWEAVLRRATRRQHPDYVRVAELERELGLGPSDPLMPGAPVVRFGCRKGCRLYAPDASWDQVIGEPVIWNCRECRVRRDDR